MLFGGRTVELVEKFTRMLLKEMLGGERDMLMETTRKTKLL